MSGTILSILCVRIHLIPPTEQEAVPLASFSRCGKTEAQGS